MRNKALLVLFSFVAALTFAVMAHAQRLEPDRGGSGIFAARAPVVGLVAADSEAAQIMQIRSIAAFPSAEPVASARPAKSLRSDTARSALREAVFQRQRWLARAQPGKRWFEKALPLSPGVRLRC